MNTKKHNLKKIIAGLKEVKELWAVIPMNKASRPGVGEEQHIEGDRQIVGWQANCPAHNDIDEGTNRPGRSLTINKISGGQINVHCRRGCTYGAIVKALKADKEEVAA